MAGNPHRGSVVIYVAAREPSKVAAGGLGKDAAVKRMTHINREILGPHQGDACLHPTCTSGFVPLADVLHPQLFKRCQVSCDHPHDA